VSLVDGALRFLLSYDAVSTVIPGTRSVAHPMSSVAAADGALPQDSVDAIRAWHARTLAGAALDW
jgi:aryl-alcohol dehydrogenase-like predicted oxidoreductase